MLLGSRVISFNVASRDSNEIGSASYPSQPAWAHLAKMSSTSVNKASLHENEAGRRKDRVASSSKALISIDSLLTPSPVWVIGKPNGWVNVHVLIEKAPVFVPSDLF